MPSARRTPRTSHVAIAAAAVFVGFAVWLLSGWSHGDALTAIDDAVLVGVSIASLVFTSLAAACTRGRTRAAWSCLAAALVAWTVAELLWTYDEVVRRGVPFPSPADAFFLMFPVGAAAGLLLLWNRRERRDWARMLLDGMIVAASLFIVSWLLVINEIHQSTTASALEFVLSLAYPITDLVLLTVATVVLIGATGTQRLAVTLLTLGLACMAVADSGYAYLSAQRDYASGDVIDIGWVAGLLLLTVAAAAGRDMPADPEPSIELPGWAAVWLPYVPLMLCALVVAVAPPGTTTSATVAGVGLLLAVMVLVRQFLAVQGTRRLLAVVAEQALRDPLTGLANRTLFTERLTHALQQLERTESAVGVLLLDLDDFKLINDTLGHRAGDAALRCAGERIAAAVQHDDAVARLGGDEFAVMTQGDPVLPETVAHRIVEAFEEPMILDGHEVRMRPSIGLAVAAAGQSGLAAEELLQHADMAMYASKRARSHQVRTFSAQLPPTETGSFAMLREFRRALDDDQLALVYQPKFRLEDGTVSGVEALLRWEHPERGTLGPDDFLPLVRRHGLIEPVTAYVLDTALDDAQRWYSAGAEIPVAVNVFPPSLAAADLPERLSAALRARGLPASALTVEITEDLLLDDIGRIRVVLEELRDRGIRLALDDFGSGYSALWYLHHLPLDQIKLDRGIVAPIRDDPRSAVIARSVIDLAHALGMETVAEGVEDPQTAAWLHRHGCVEAQGFYFSPPLLAAEVMTLPAPAAAKSS